MTRLSVILCGVLTLMLSIGLFRITYQVDALEKDLRTISRDIKQEQETIHILNAEWSYLNDPNRLEDLTKRYLDMDYTKGNQLVDFDSLNSLPFQEPTPAPKQTPATYADPTPPFIAWEGPLQ